MHLLDSKSSGIIYYAHRKKMKSKLIPIQK